LVYLSSKTFITASIHQPTLREYSSIFLPHPTRTRFKKLKVTTRNFKKKLKILLKKYKLLLQMSLGSTGKVIQSIKLIQEGKDLRKKILLLLT